MAKITERLNRLEAAPLDVEQRLRLAKQLIRNGGEFTERKSPAAEDQGLSEARTVLLGCDRGLPGTDEDFQKAQERGWGRVTGINPYPAMYPAQVERLLQKVQRELAQRHPIAADFDESFA